MEQQRLMQQQMGEQGMPLNQEMVADAIMPSEQMIDTGGFDQVPVNATDRFFDYIAQANFMFDDINDNEKGAYEDCEMINESQSQTEFKFEDLQDLDLDMGEPGQQELHPSQQSKGSAKAVGGL